MAKLWNSDNGDGTYTNPVLYGDYSDPDCIRVGDDYYMISSSFSNAPGIPVLHSKDLVNWELINYVLGEIPGDRYRRAVHGCGVWAPAIRYHDGLYYVCFPMPDEGIFMCTAKDPAGQWSDPVCIREGAGWIDPCPFWDDDGKAYLVAGVAKSRIGYKSVLHMTQMQPDGMGLIGDEVKVFDGNENDQVTIEGPKLYKRGGWYYIFAPAGGVKNGWQTVLRSRDIFGPYEYRVVMRQGDTPVNGPHQGAWVDTASGEDWFLHFQDVYCAGRIIHLQPMSWEDDWPIIGERAGNENWGKPVLRHKKPDIPGTFPLLEPPAGDDFRQGRLSPAWQWNANPLAEWYGFSDGALELWAQKRQGYYTDAPGLLLQKWPAPEFICVTEMDLSHLCEGDEAGVISMGMSYALLSFVREEGGYRIRTVTGEQRFGKIEAEETTENTADAGFIEAGRNLVYIKYEVQRTGTQKLSEGDALFPVETVGISWSTDGYSYTQALSAEAVPGRWVGVKNGVFCLSQNEESRGRVRVLRVDYRRGYHNPVKRGFSPDPSVVRVGDDYYMVNSTFQYFPAIAISHSRDMVHWELIGHAITDPEYLDLSEIKDSHGIWAPDIEYADGRFIIMATLRVNGDGKRGNNVLRRQLVVSSDRPEGPYSRPVWIEVDNIDPSLFVDDDGKKYLLISPGVNILPLSDDCTRVVGEQVCIWPGTGERCPEGPHLFKKDGWYYAVLAEGGTGYGHGINVARSRELFGPYESSPYNPVMRQTDPKAQIQRCGHGKFIEAADHSWWVFYLCGRRNGGNYTTIGRETALDSVRWLDDGWFLINEGMGPGSFSPAPELKEVHLTRRNRDDFDSPTLGKEWEFVRNPFRGDLSLSERPGWLRIWTADGTLSEIRAKNTLLRREEELSYCASTLLDFYPEKDGEQAGLTCYYSTATYVRFSLCHEGGRKLQLVINRGHGEEIVAESGGIKPVPVYLKVVTEGLTRSFCYSYDGEEWTETGVLENCVYLCDEGVPDDPKRHTGTLVGVYANNGGCGSRISADFDFFECIGGYDGYRVS